MEMKHKLKLLEIVLDKASGDNWYTEDVVYCWNELYKTLV